MSHEQDTKPPYAVYTYHVTDPTETITQVLGTSARTKRSSSSNGSGGTTIKMENPYKSKSGLNSSISQFLAKLWRLVNDEDTDDKICWSEDGLSFIVKDQASFSMELLPRYFKHHNFSSFVRQLNMYGFRKVVNTEHGGLRCIKDDYQFINKNFCRDRPELLELVKRKPSSTTHPNIHHGTKEADDNIASTLKKVLTEVHHLKKDNDRIRHSFEKLKEENTKVFNEVENLNKKNNNQSIIIQKIIKFIWSLAHQQNSISKQSRMMIENGDASGSRYGEIMDPNWTEERRSQPVSPAGPRSPSRYGERVNKVGSDLQSIQNLLSSQNLPFDIDVVNDLFEYNSEYVSPAMSPAPGSSYNGSAPPSPAGPSGVNTAPPTTSPTFNVQVEQYPEETVPSTMSMASPSYIQHPSSPNQRQTSPARSPHQRHLSPSPSPVQRSPHISPNVSPHVSPHVSPYISPHVSPHISPHVSPHVSPHMSPHTSPVHSVSYQQMSNYPVGVASQASPVYAQNVGMTGGSPVRQQFAQQYDPYSRSPGKQPYPGYVSDRSGLQSDHVVKKPKLSAYTQNIQWDDEDYGEEEESKIDPSTFFTK